jgi:hypothetical protein
MKISLMHELGATLTVAMFGASAWIACNTDNPVQERKTDGGTDSGGSTDSGGETDSTDGSNDAGLGPRLVGDIPVPGIADAAPFSFDLGIVVGPRFYFTDRNHKAVDVVDIAAGTLTTQIGGDGGFTGCQPSPTCVGAKTGLSGPNGIDAIPGTNLLFVGDVDSVKVIDRTVGAAGQIIKTIPVGTTGFRADEGCFDADDGIYMISSPDSPTPFASFIQAKTQTLIATVLFTDPSDGGAVSAGLEQCAYDPATKSFFVNNDGTIANPHGEADVIPANLITPYLTTPMAAGTSTTLAALGATVKAFPLPAVCDPTGMALGPGTDLAIECREGTKGAPLVTLILNRANGAMLAAVPFGGGDQIAYDPTSDRYYVAGSRWTSNGLSPGPGCNAANACTPTLGIIDATSRTLVTRLATGNGAHSVAVDPISGRIFMPYSSPTAGCQNCALFPNNGISIFTTK